jgi:release factor glutamine methyltransferase
MDYGIEDAEKEAELIVTTFAGLDRTKLYRDNPVLDENETRKIQEAQKRRCRREPMAYILSSVNFHGLRIITGPGVLVPRPETELIVDEILKMHSPSGQELNILDLMTGSGCLALAIARALPNSWVTGTDISEDALRHARKSARINNISNVTFIRGSIFEPVKDMRFDLIISNPPYIRNCDINNLQPEIREWEPREALDGGLDGLDFLREILQLAPEHLAPGGHIILELGSGQGHEVSSIACKSGLEPIALIKDYSGIERILSARLPQDFKEKHIALDARLNR